MDSTSSENRGEGLTLRQVALVAGFGYLLGPVTYAEFSIYPKLVIPTNMPKRCLHITGRDSYAENAASPIWKPALSQP
jgi:hypothetical protein